MHELVVSISATWSPFVLVAGLLLVGHVAANEGVFRLAGAWCSRAPGGGVALYLVMMALVALVTAFLNLDTSVVFMTPLALNAARTRGTDETALLYGTVFMSNAASLLLLGSNLTNLLVFARRGTTSLQFTGRTVAPWLVSVVLTTTVVLVWRWRPLRRAPRRSVEMVSPPVDGVGVGVVAVVVAVVAMLATRNPALWVLGAGVVATVFDALLRQRWSWRGALAAVHPSTLSALFVLACLIGWFARSTAVLRGLLTHANELTTTLLAALSTVVVNNLPAASFFAAHDVAHPYALLLGLNLGPNCFVTGALSSLLWLRIARRDEASVSVATFVRVGTVVAVITMAGALLTLT